MIYTVHGALNLGPILPMVFCKPIKKGDKMKLSLILAAVAAVQLAQADSFTIIRDSKEYLCEQRGPSNPIDGLECVNKAYGGPFSREEAQILCAGAPRSTAPADCALKAYSGPYSKDEAIRMCKEQPLLVLRSLKLIEQSMDLKEKVQRIKQQINDK